MLKGTITSGVGEGAFFMGLEPYAQGMEKALHYLPFKGTLNLNAKKEEAEMFLKTLQKITVPGFTKGVKEFGAVECYPCLLKGVKVAIIIPHFTRYDLSTIEIVAKEHLRTSLNLKDGDTIELKAL